ncbi:MAG: hypothetical protein ACKVTZ_11300, partial [Bacteroidia bacterium]
MKQRFYFFFLLVFMMAKSPLFSQVPVILHLQSGSYDLAGNKFLSAALASSQAYEGKKYLIFQFESLPSELEKQQMERVGIKLLAYLPQNAWIAEVNESVSSLYFQGFHLHAVGAFLPTFKLSSELMQQKYPAHARLANGQIALQIQLVQPFSLEKIAPNLLAVRATNLQTTEFPQTINLSIEQAKIAELAQLPFISYIAPTIPPQISELTYRNT